MTYRPPPGPHRLVAVDLGKKKVGVAVGMVIPATKVCSLVAAWTVTLPERLPWSPEAMAERVNLEVDAVWAATVTVGALKVPRQGKDRDVWVCEWPKKYPEKPKYHDDIDLLWRVGSAIRGRWAKKYAPSAWKGNVPKAVHHPRIFAAVRDDELANIAQALYLAHGYDASWIMSDDAHDARDALGIWLFATGRTGRGGTRV